MSLKQIDWTANPARTFFSGTLSPAEQPVLSEGEGLRINSAMGLGLGGVTPPDASPLRLAQHDICFSLDARNLVQKYFV